MDFSSDDSTLVNSEAFFSSASSPVPQSNYLWFSPHGQAYPGAHHQLLLHLLAIDTTWNQDSPKNDFSVIEMWLRDSFPRFMVSESVLRAVAAEYESINDDLKVTYRDIMPNMLLIGVSQEADVSGATSSPVTSRLAPDQFPWRTTIDPALLQNADTVTGSSNLQSAMEQVPPASPTIMDREQLFWGTPDKSNPDSHSGQMSLSSGAGNRVSSVLKRVKQNEFLPNTFTKETNTARDSLDIDYDMTEDLQQSQSQPDKAPLLVPNVVLLPSTPLKNHILHTPLRPAPNRIVRNLSGNKFLSLSRQSPTPRSRMSSHTGSSTVSSDDIVVADENEGIHSALEPNNFANARQESKSDSISTAMGGQHSSSEPVDVRESKRVPKSRTVSDKSLLTPAHLIQSLLDNNQYETTTIVGRPDPSKFVESSKNHMTIPYSEAVMFMASWKEGDEIPEKIEGYYWYCDRCFSSEPSWAVTSPVKQRTEPGPKSLQKKDLGRKGTDLKKRKQNSVIRGKFSGKRSFEKHYQDTHRVHFKVIRLPEPERKAGMTAARSSGVVNSADIDYQESVESKADHELVESENTVMSTPSLVEDDVLEETPPTPSMEDIEAFNGRRGYAPDSIRKTLFSDRIEELEKEHPSRGIDKQARWEAMKDVDTNSHRLRSDRVVFEETEQVGDFNKEQALADEAGYDDNDQASPVLSRRADRAPSGLIETKEIDVIMKEQAKPRENPRVKSNARRRPLTPERITRSMSRKW